MALLQRAAVVLIALPWALALAGLAAALGFACWLWLVLADLIAWPFVRIKVPTEPPPGGVRRAVSCVTVSWNGRHFLEQLLPSLQAELDRWGHESEIVVVDNGSEDGTVAWLRAEWPEVRIVALPENRYFVRGCMAGAEVARHPTLVVLNNDMVVEEGFLPPLLEALERPGVFGVSSQIFLQDPEARREESGLTGGGFRHGVLKLAHLLPVLDQLDGAATVPTLWAGGGSSAYDRAAFTALGGFDTLYDPFYVEDLALSYAAWIRGWTVLFAPESRVRHAHRGTSRKAFGDRFVDGMIRRNQHLFVWKMVHDPVWTLTSLATVPLLILARWRGARPFGDPWFEASALLRAMPRFPRAALERQRQRRCRVRSDREVFEVAGSIHRAERGLATSRDASGPLRLLFLAGRLPRRGVDGSWSVVELLTELARRGHRITLLAWVEDERERELGAPLEALGIRVEVVVRRRYRAVANLHLQTPERLARDYSHPELGRAVVDALQTVAFDVVQVDYIEMAHVARRWLADVPWVYVCHEAQEAAASGGGGFERARAAVHEGDIVRCASHVVCLTEEDAGLVRSPAAAAVSVVPTSLDPSPWIRPQGVPRGDREIVFVGSFDHPPNVDAARWLVDEIFPAVRARVADARLTIIGRSPPAGLEAREGVECSGFVEDLAAVLHRAAVAVVPVRLGGGIRSKVLEAWAAGCAVVGTPLAVAGMGVKHGDQALVAGDAEGLSAALVRCLCEPDLRDRLGDLGRERLMERFVVSRQADDYESIYRSLAGGAR